MAPTLAKTKGTGTKRAAARPANTPEAASIKLMINGETVINGDFDWGVGLKLQKAWVAILAGAKTAKTTGRNKATARGGMGPARGR